MATVDPDLPGSRQGVDEAAPGVTRPWYQWFLKVAQRLFNAEQAITALQQASGGGGSSGAGNIIGRESITALGALPGVVTLTLVNDLGTVPGHYRYGTDDTGSKGWQAVGSDFVASINIPFTTTVNGAVTFDLSHTGVTAGVYGDSSHVAQVTVDVFGRVTNVTQVAIAASISEQQVMARISLGF